MSGVLLFASVVLPFALAVMLGFARTRALALALAPWGALPALLAALLLPVGTTIATPWLFLGGAFGLDLVSKVFLGFSAAIWLAAGIYGRGYLTANHDAHTTRFFAFFLATMGGNLALVPTLDMATYIAFFAIMSFSAYGLILHERTPSNVFAGRVYIAMTVVGEVAAFGGMVWAATLAGGSAGFSEAMQAIAGTPEQTAILTLLFIGFGIKLGVMPLHIWLPLAHPAAPTPASAVLSGVMIKTGLLLWLRLFPLDAPALFDGGALVLVGLVTAFAAAIIGMTQTHPKSLLAYSSISQMGLAAIAVGAAMLTGMGTSALVPVILLFATHHAVAKCALFFGVGLAQSALSPAMRKVLVAGLALAGAALAGIPFTSGMAAKAGIKYLGAETGTAWTPVLDWLLPLTGITTMLLIVRYLFLIAPAPAHPHGRANAWMLAPWALLTLAVPVIPFFVVGMGWFEAKSIGLYGAGIVAAAWPPAVAIALGLLVWKSEALRASLATITVRPGDVVFALIWLQRGIAAFLRVTVLRPALAAQKAPAQVETLSESLRSMALRRAAQSESFALGIVLMTLIALGMAFLL